LRQTDQARTDFAAIESDLELIQKQLARLTTRRKLAGTALGIIFATMMLTTPEFAVLSALRMLCKRAWTSEHDIMRSGVDCRVKVGG
jgi:hypothetical protein